MLWLGIELRLVAQLRREGEEMVRIGASVRIGWAHTNYETHIADTCLCSMCSVEQLYFVPYKQKDGNVIKQKTIKIPNNFELDSTFDIDIL